MTKSPIVETAQLLVHMLEVGTTISDTAVSAGGVSPTVKRNLGWKLGTTG